jgi:hypothetical protein
MSSSASLGLQTSSCAISKAGNPDSIARSRFLFAPYDVELFLRGIYDLKLSNLTSISSTFGRRDGRSVEENKVEIKLITKES